MPASVGSVAVRPMTSSVVPVSQPMKRHSLVQRLVSSSEKVNWDLSLFVASAQLPCLNACEPRAARLRRE